MKHLLFLPNWSQNQKLFDHSYDKGISYLHMFYQNLSSLCKDTQLETLYITKDLTRMSYLTEMYVASDMTRQF